MPVRTALCDWTAMSVRISAEQTKHVRICAIDNVGVCAEHHKLMSVVRSSGGLTIEYIAVCCDCLRQDAFVTSHIRIEVLHEVKAFP